MSFLTWVRMPRKRGKGCTIGTSPRARFTERTQLTMEEMSEVEKLKAKRRAENAAKRAAAGDAPPEEATDAPPLAAPTPPPAPPTESGPLAQLSKAEAKADALATEMAAIQSEAEGAKDTEALDALSKRSAACSGGVGQLQSLMDEIDIGDLDDEARTAARARRKAINARVEGELEPAKGTLSKAIMAARAKLA